MARIIGKNIIGAVGPVTFSTWRGKQTMKARVGKNRMKQTAATKKASSIFGMASKFSSAIRHAMFALHCQHDGTMVNRLNAETAAILRKRFNHKTGNYDIQPDTFRPLEGFEFNQYSPLKDKLYILPEIRLDNGTLKIHMPSINAREDLYRPKGMHSCTILFVVYIASIKTRECVLMTNDNVKSIKIGGDQQATVAQDWAFDIPEGCFCITGMAIHYHENWSDLDVSMNSKALSPAMICDFSINPGIFQSGLANWTSCPFAFEDQEIKGTVAEKVIPHLSQAILKLESTPTDTPHQTEDQQEEQSYESLKKELELTKAKLAGLENLLSQKEPQPVHSKALTDERLPFSSDMSTRLRSAAKAAVNDAGKTIHLPSLKKQAKVRGKPKS